MQEARISKNAGRSKLKATKEVLPYTVVWCTRCAHKKGAQGQVGMSDKTQCCVHAQVHVQLMVGKCYSRQAAAAVHLSYI